MIILESFQNESFDLIINRYRAFNPKDVFRLLKKSEIFIPKQVGGNNDRDLVEKVLPDTKKTFSLLNLKEQKKLFENVGFQIVEEDENLRSIKFFDVDGFV